MIPYDPLSAAMMEGFFQLAPFLGAIPGLTDGRRTNPAFNPDGSTADWNKTNWGRSKKNRKAVSEGASTQNKNSLIPATEGAKALFEDGIVRVESNDHNLTVAAANNTRIQLASDFKTNLWDILNTEDDKVPVIRKSRFTWTLTGDSKFIAYVFLVLMEDGETIASTDSNSYYK
jgi:hypothetical protein